MRRAGTATAALGAALAAAAACGADVSYDGTRYQCPDERCPSGYSCVAGYCERGGPDPDDGGRPDGPPPPGGADAGAPGVLLGVPAGDFSMGCAIALDPGCPLDTIPERTVTLSAYQIEATEVTRGAYRDCVAAGACPQVAAAASGDARLPVTSVPWAAAVGYCAWLGRKLPTEAQWERAARGVDDRYYPWGDAPAPSCALATFAGCGGPTLAGTRTGDQSPVGGRDLAGNAAEWVADWYQPAYLPGGSDVDPTGPATGQEKVVRGGSLESAPDGVRTFARDKAAPGTSAPRIGFRCAK